MMNHLTLLFSVFVILMMACVVLAHICANHDAGVIHEHETINHKRAWRFRAGMMIVVSAVLASPFPVHWSAWAAMSLFSAGCFSITFRPFLNISRGKHLLYVSPSNLYDRLWIDIAYRIESGIRWLFRGYRLHGPKVAAVLAMLFEVTLMTIGVVILVAQALEEQWAL